MKRLFILIFAAFLFSVNAAAATDFPSPTNRFFVNDFANVISAEDENAIYAMGAQLFEKTGAQVVAVTVDDLGGVDIDQYALLLGRDWGVGDKEKDTGVVLLLAVNDREVSIQVGYGLEGAITDIQSGILLDEYALPYFSEDDFSAGMHKTYNAIVNEVYIEFDMEPDEHYTPVEELEQESDFGIGELLIVLLILALVFFGRGRGFFPFFFFGGGGYHGGHSGGGGFSGGGFRGGGGSFGGGGASRKF